MLYLTGKWHRYFADDIRFGVMSTIWTVSKPPAPQGVLWALDNGCFTRPQEYRDELLFKTLDTLSAFRRDCLFVVAPDVVGSARLTWERSQPVLPTIRARGYSAAFVAQDGLTVASMPDWDAFDALFIGGSTAFKLSAEAQALIHAARTHGKWVHMGRVNTLRRLRYAYYEGCHSVDGTAVAFRPDELAADLTRWMGALEL